MVLDVGGACHGGGGELHTRPSTSISVVVPTVGRSCLPRLLEALAGQGFAASGAHLFLVDDRPGRPSEAPVGLLDRIVPAALAPAVTVVRSGGGGPAAARNAGWTASVAEAGAERVEPAWVVFLDDDVVPAPGWMDDLAADLSALPHDVAGSQGRVEVPLPHGRPPTDWERNVKGLESARWATADMAYRRPVLAAVGGFDERFPRAYREDADIGLRVTAAGYRIVQGRRRVLHPVRPARRWVSVRLQAGNADDALMRAIHGRCWRERAGVPRGRRPRHVVTTLAGVAGALGLAARRRGIASLALAVWAAGSAELAWARIRHGPRTSGEVTTMLLTSAVMPPVATFHWLAGTLRARRLAGRQGA